MENKIEIKNKRARFEYFLSDELSAGIVLSGTEIKSIRLGKVNITDAYCAFFQGELYVKNMHISEYVFGSYNKHEPRSERKLLLNRRELKKYEIKTKEIAEIYPPELQKEKVQAIYIIHCNVIVSYSLARGWMYAWNSQRRCRLNFS